MMSKNLAAFSVCFASIAETALAGGYGFSGTLKSVHVKEHSIELTLSKSAGVPPLYTDFLSMGFDASDCSEYYIHLMDRPYKTFWGVQVWDDVGGYVEQFSDLLSDLVTSKSEIQFLFIGETGDLVQTSACSFKITMDVWEFSGLRNDPAYLKLGL